ncbi:pyridoxal 5'-phosphate synthase glutaminase subunit PdxT [Fodinisporobacter ferrooxydans]|uniref:Pyridoxal 5'-phosphate synthase subunit PdxT n=1 Tax=Fodinisporobacter ferrooxydans TaxID=2901836 RepID=A0ABY4CV62_9BACL|nr:pyridoxal 5'-phosphate synthase glutaminase subunit PdxT [Alicyclobacillaceae bacterium MYW30-H2]
MKVGVLALQGAVAEHARALRAAGANEVVSVKRVEDLKDLGGLVLPGGESTTIGKLMRKYDLMDTVREMAVSGIPMFGTCAGLILLAKRIHGEDYSHLGLMDIEVDRNSFGRQRESFEVNLNIPVLGEESYPAVFIRAPHIIEAGAGVDILCEYDGRIVAAKQGNLLGASFHPELTEDIRLHHYFIDMVARQKSAS